MVKKNVSNFLRRAIPVFAKIWIVSVYKKIGIVFNIDNGNSAATLALQENFRAEFDQVERNLNLAIEQRNIANTQAIEAKKTADFQVRDMAFRSVLLANRLSRIIAEVRMQMLRPTPAFQAFNAASDRGRICIIYSAHTQLFHLKELLVGLIAHDRTDIVIYSFVSVKDTAMLDFCKSLNAVVIENGQFLTDYIPGFYDAVEDMSVLLEPRDLAYARCTEGISIDSLISGMTTEVTRQVGVERYIRSFFSAMATVALVLFEENAETDSTIWTNVARREGIPCVIVPFTIADKTEPAESHYHDDLFWAESDNLFNSYVAQHLPIWTYHFKERTLIRRPGLVALVNEMLGYSQPDPWVLNSSKSALVAVESPRMMKHYVDLNIDPSHLIMTGSFSDDVLSRATGEVDAIKAELGLDPTKKILLCAFPPNQLTATRSACQFSSYEEIIDFWLGCLAFLTEWQVVVAPHPLMSESHINLLRAKGYVTSLTPVSRLIAIADLYNASVSSTIRWALALGKPVLNFDVFQYRYRDFVDVPGVRTVVEATEFEQAIAEFARQPAALVELSNAAQHNAAEWGLVDGRSGERILDLICDVSVQPGRRPRASGFN